MEVLDGYIGEGKFQKHKKVHAVIKVCLECAFWFSLTLKLKFVINDRNHVRCIFSSFTD